MLLCDRELCGAGHLRYQHRCPATLECFLWLHLCTCQSLYLECPLHTLLVCQNPTEASSASSHTPSSTMLLLITAPLQNLWLSLFSTSLVCCMCFCCYSFSQCIGIYLFTCPFSRRDHLFPVWAPSVHQYPEQRGFKKVLLNELFKGKSIGLPSC